MCVKPGAMTDRMISENIGSTAEIKVLQDIWPDEVGN